MAFELEVPVLKNYIGGKWVSAHTEYLEPVPNPATGELLAQVPFSSQTDVELAVQAAKAAFPEWSRMPVPKRARILFKYQQLLVEHWDELDRLVTLENGKSYKEAYGEVQRGIENVEFAAGAPSLMMGTQLPDIATDLESGMYRYPVGVVGGITPFNFPMMVPAWMFPLAVALGNTFVLKPSERAPLTAQRLVELFAEAGLPDGVLNLVHGAHDVVNGLLEHPDVKAISFVGSQPVAEYVYTTGAARGKRVQALAGAKNHTIIMPDADLDQAVSQVISAAYGSAGERCMATSVVVPVGDIADVFVEKLLAAAERVTIGNGFDENVVLGPVIRDSQKERAAKYIEIGESEGAKVLRDGRQDKEFASSSGFFIGPSILDHVKPGMKVWRDEIFAPVLSIVRAKDLDDAIRIANQSDFANGACIFTDSAKAIRKFREEIDAGMLGVNIGIPAPMAFFPFSGWKKSFYGDLHANGRDGVEFYTRRKMVTARHSYHNS